MAGYFLEYVSSNHVDIGVGTGYYLKRYLPNKTKRIALVDLNLNSLESTSQAIKRFNPDVYCRNVFEPLNLNGERFDSVSVNYLFHCLPGAFSDKGKVFANLKAIMNEGGVIFGSTILGRGVSTNLLAKKLMDFYNKKAIFSNVNDDIESLESALKLHFSGVKIQVIGCVALFSAIKKEQ